jgi:tRNA threonylcarbamoyladenosine biosynthesis protein TsaB
MQGPIHVLGIDTCGPIGSVALGELVQIGPDQDELRILGQTELAGRTYSATLVASVSELLTQANVGLAQVNAIVVVNGPGSFTGVRVGLSAVKGLAESRDGIQVLAVSRLEVLASMAGIPSAALDAHRNEVFLRLAGSGLEGRELLAGAQELAAIDRRPERIAVCDDSAAALLSAAWPGTEFVRVLAPTAADAMALCLPHVSKGERAGERADLALLDGHYLRRSDAEIFGEAAAAEPRRP